jgi:hypothetical protein
MARTKLINSLQNDILKQIGKNGIRGMFKGVKTLNYVRLFGSVFGLIVFPIFVYQFRGYGWIWFERIAALLFAVSIYETFITIAHLIPKYFYNSLKFICPHCLHTIFTKNISNFTCPFCNEGGKTAIQLFSRCDCGSVIKNYECPHCHKSIDLFKKYDLTSLENKRYKKPKDRSK